MGLKRTSQGISVSEYAVKVERQRQIFRKYCIGFLFLAPYLFFFVLFFAVPFFKGITISFFRYNIADTTDIVWRGVQNYTKILFDKNSTYYKTFWNGMKNTLMATAILVPLSIVIPLLLATLVNTKPVGYKFFRAIIYLPSIFPMTATGVIFLNLFNNNYGFVSAIFGDHINWLMDPTYNWILIIFFCIWSGIGGNFIIFLAGLQTVDPSLKEASSIDGCNLTKRFFHVTLAQIKPQLILCFFNTTIGYMNLYGQNYLLGQYVSDRMQIQTTVFVIQELMMGTNFQVYGMVSAMAICLGLFIMTISIIQLIVTRERKGGNKHAKEYFSIKGAN
ncbi:MAG: carbohydrate ABC transporter permease [Bacilli bacterium]|jgi:multiple sugar transport system permease protein